MVRLLAEAAQRHRNYGTTCSIPLLNTEDNRENVENDAGLANKL